MERCLDRVRQHSEAMQWVQEECRLGSRQWKRAGRQSGIQEVAVFHVLDSFTFLKGFPCLEIGRRGMHCG